MSLGVKKSVLRNFRLSLKIALPFCMLMVLQGCALFGGDDEEVQLPTELVEFEAVIEVDSMGSFEAKYEEIKGDIFSKKGKFSEAQSAYLKALELLLPGEFDYEYIQMKFKDIQNEDPDGSEELKDGNA